MQVFKPVSQSLMNQVLDASSKQVKNDTAFTIPAQKALAWKDDGSVDKASALTTDVTDFAGFSEASIPYGQFGKALRKGNVAGILTGMGAIPGQVVYLSETPGEVTLTAPTAPGTTVLKLGMAEPSSNSITGEATDLLIEVEFIVEN